MANSWAVLVSGPQATPLALALAKGLLGINLSFIFVILKEEQKGKKKKNTKKKLSAPNASKEAQEGSSPEPKLESQASSLTDHEYTAGASTFGVAQPNRGSQPMAPGVFLTQRRPSSSSQNNASAKGTRKRLACGAGVGKGEGPCNPSLLQGLQRAVGMHRCRCVHARQVSSGIGPVAVLALGSQRGVFLLAAGCEGCHGRSTAPAQEHLQGDVPDSLPAAADQGRMHPHRLLCPGLGQALCSWWWLDTSSVLTVAEVSPPRTCRAGHTAEPSGEGAEEHQTLGKGRREEEVACCLP